MSVKNVLRDEGCWYVKENNFKKCIWDAADAGGKWRRSVLKAEEASVGTAAAVFLLKSAWRRFYSRGISRFGMHAESRKKRCQ